MPHSHPSHILLVNDDSEESAGYQQELSATGYTVSCAESGHHALQMLAESSHPNPGESEPRLIFQSMAYTLATE